jgi:uncharacterized membrane protein
MSALHAVLSIAEAPMLRWPQVSFPQSPAITEQIVLRWLHIVAGIIWIGTLYFNNLAATPALKLLDPPVRAKIYPALMSRAMWWFRWSALVTVVAGLRYFWMILAADAHNAGNSSLAVKWFGEWLVVWIVAFALIYPFQLPHKGVLDNVWVRALAISAIAMAASWLTLILNANPQSSNSHLSIAIGGGMGMLMLLNAWGIIWRAQKKLIHWMRAAAEQGVPVPAEAAHFARWAFLASRTGFWMSFPMLWFMAAADHYPFLNGNAG